MKQWERLLFCVILGDASGVGKRREEKGYIRMEQQTGRWEEEQFERTRLLYGSEAIERLHSAKVAVFGIGGVGGYVAEALARCGVGHLMLVDHDTVSVTNLNRQIIALHSTVGRYKVDVMAERITDINPAAQVEACRCFYLPETADRFDFASCSYIVDAVDTVTAKLSIIERAKACGVPVISSMGAGNKTDPTLFRIMDLYETSVCPLAKVMRRECRKRGIRDLKVVCSSEEPVYPAEEIRDESGRKVLPGSTAFVPSAAGLALASEVVRDLLCHSDVSPACAGVHERGSV